MSDELRRLDEELKEAEERAIDALARYKFTMFGYWAGIWVHLNRISGSRYRNPFTEIVKTARTLRARDLEERNDQ